MDKLPLIILTGPTAVGKTALSIRLAQAIRGEIISADSMQVYRGMDIGTAKIREEEKQGVPHFLLDEYDPKDEFNVVLFQQKAKQYMQEIRDRGHIPIIVGGTGFYIQSVLYDIDFTETESHNGIRDELEELARVKGAEWLHEELKKVDPESAEQIHANNVKRVIRALEYYRQTGEPISVHNARERERSSPYAFCYFVLNQNRAVLYDRINQRIDQMLEEGLIEEVKRLKEEGCTRELVSMQGLGYKEILAYLEGELTLEEAVYLLKRDTRHFAKRQLTWFGRERDVIWIDKEKYENEDAILAFMIKQMEERVY